MPLTIMCPHCQTVNQVPAKGPIWCSKCKHQADAKLQDCLCWFCAPEAWHELPGQGIVSAIPGIDEPPHSLEVQSDGWEISLDIGNNVAVLCVSTTPEGEDFGPHIIDRSEIFPLLKAMVHLLTLNERHQLLGLLVQVV